MKKIALAAALTGMMAAASAQVYVAGNVGQSHFSADCSGVENCDKSDVGYKLTVGYKLNPLVAIEASYVDFGKVKGTVRESGVPVNVDIKSNGLLFAAALRYQAAPALDLVGRLGLSSLKSKATASAFGVNASESYSSTKPYIGLGVEYALNKQLRLTAGADFTRIKLDGESGSIRLLSVGTQYDF